MRGAVVLVTATLTPQKSRVVFQCPMTVGYQRWVPASVRSDNPSQGHRMRTSGTAVPRWSPQAVD
jgi:hypothetical protein